MSAFGIYRSRPDTLALAIALFSSLAVLAAFFTDIVLSRQNELDDSRTRLSGFTSQLAEHTSRSHEAIDALLAEMANDLSIRHRNWRDWTPSEGWEYTVQHHSRSLPQLRSLIVFDQKGDQRFISTYYPTPHINISDRPYFAPLKGGAEFTSYGPYVGRNSGRYSYALARRIHDGSGKFAGIAFAALEPGYFQEFCWSGRISEESEAVLINKKGQVVASCRPTDLSRHSAVIGNLATESLFDGRLKGMPLEAGLHQWNGHLVSLTPITAYPDLSVLAVLPESTALANWYRRAKEFSIFASIIVFVLLTGGWLVRRQVAELGTITQELVEHRIHLEDRIQESTAELAAQKEEAEFANLAKSRFLAAASHDLRQPLHALSLFSADLQRQVRHSESPELVRLAEQIGSAAGVLGELLDSLLDISRLDVAGVNPDIRPFPIQQTFDRLEASFRRAAQNKTIALRLRPSRLWVSSDPVLIERLLANLVSNAIRYTPQGGKVLVSARSRQESVLIEVRDNGIGIAPEHQDAIFAEFYQVGNAARESGRGLGLGLSIVDRLARALALPLHLHSEINRGTNFSITLPRIAPVAAPEPISGPLTNQPQLTIVGSTPELDQIATLAGNWQYAVRRISPADSADDTRAGADQPLTILQGETGAAFLETHSGSGPVIWIDGPDDLDLPGVHLLHTPIRPAKLRALLQKLLSLPA